MARIAPVLLLVALLSEWAAADLVWTPEDGWFIPSGDVVISPEDILKQSDKAFAAERYRDAARGYELLIEGFPKHEGVPRAYRQLLESQFRAKDYEDALDTAELVLALQPDAKTVEYVLDRRYAIGVAFISGHRRRFLGISYSGESFGVDVLESYVERFPLQPNSDDALFHIASHYQRTERYRKAEIVYDRLIEDYPQSEWAGTAEYQIGVSNLSRLKGVEYDFRPVKEAQRRFLRYLDRYPDGDKADQAEAGLRRVSRLQAAKLLEIAKFYQREGKPQAVRYYLVKILREHPNTPAWVETQKLMEQVGSVGETP